jgi:hypothetical protein
MSQATEDLTFPGSIVVQVLDPTYIEHDAFMIFQRIMASIISLYPSGKSVAFAWAGRQDSLVGP